MKDHRFWTAYVVLLVVAAMGCVAGENNAVDATEVDGEVGGGNFEVRSSTADYVGGEYVVSISDTAELSCDASSGLPMSYRVVRIVQVDAPGTFDAADLVTFDDFEFGVSESEMATSGTVTIEAIGFGSIKGEVDARGRDSEIKGSFVAEICN